MNKLEAKLPQELPLKIWHSNFPNQPFPERMAIEGGADHQVVLLGNGNQWDHMMRFGITRDIAVESNLLDYLSAHNPPVQLVKTIKTIETGASPPFDKCLIQTPVNGEILDQYLKHSDISQQQQVGEVLGKFVRWVSTLSPNMFTRKDVLREDFKDRKEISLQKLLRCGLGSEQARYLIAEIDKLFGSQSVLLPCHGDLYPPHIFADSSSQVGIIDWGDSTLAEPLRDFRFWYEPFEDLVYKDLYPDAFKAACQALREEFPNPDEDRRLKLYALVGELDYDEDKLEPVASWIEHYLKYFQQS